MHDDLLPGETTKDTGSAVLHRLADLAAIEFDRLPRELLVRAFGVEYAHIAPPEGGDLYVTRLGWPYVLQLLPNNWYAQQWYAKEGEKLPGSTGSVYHVLSKSMNGKQADLVVKFSRVAQEVPLVVATTFPENVPAEVIAAARFNSPMEEFGLVMELRQGTLGPTDIRIRTHRPLGIYTPPEQFQLWQLGRDTSRFHVHRRLLAEDQESAVKAIELDIKRIYVMLYGWIKGKDAEETWEEGSIAEQELRALTPRVIDELKQKGFRVLDNKPRHFILRRRRHDGRVMRRDGHNLTYALVDFELLQRTPEHHRRFKADRQDRYWQLQAKRHIATESPIPTHLKRVKVFGVDYVFGRAQDGGQLWVVGQNPDLFDYFVPDRWRRTPRIKLSLQNEVYRTRTRDNIDVVYRRSRVGSRPRVDPLTGEGRRIREHGYNSPFEEVVIAERLRQMGIPTTFPRAIYRTGHQSTKAAYLRDPRHFEDHARLVTPEDMPEPVLVPDYDYYTIWDHFRGLTVESGRTGHHAMYLHEALENGLLDSGDCEAIRQRVQSMLQNSGLEEERADDYEFSVCKDKEGRASRDAAGTIDATFGIDALTAYEVGLISEEIYRATLRRLDERLRAADCEKLDLKGSHVLLSMDPDGRFKMNPEGDLRVALCNFEFIRGLYRPIR